MRIKRIEDAAPEDIERAVEDAFWAVMRRVKGDKWDVRYTNTGRRVGD